MEGNESGLSAYYHHQQQQHLHHHHHNATNTTPNSSVNGIFSNPNHHSSSASHFTSSEGASLVFSPHSVTGRAPTASATVSQETVKRKRGRPRKYGTSETPSSASPSASAKKASGSNSSIPLSSPPRKDEHSLASTSSSSKKAQLVALGNAGQGFTPHVITVAAGEDVAQKIMSFMQQRKRALCILSASGSISNASLRQPATFGGNVTYEGRFEILSLSGSFLHSEIGGSSSRTGGLSVCLSSTDGRIIGGGVGGPLKAAGPVQVIVGSFVIDTKKDVSAGQKVEASANKLPPSMVGATVSSIAFRSPTDLSGRISRGNDDHQSFGGSSFMLQSWRTGMNAGGGAGFELTGRADHGACQSSEDGDEEQIRD